MIETIIYIHYNMRYPEASANVKFAAPFPALFRSYASRNELGSV